MTPTTRLLGTLALLTAALPAFAGDDASLPR